MGDGLGEQRRQQLIEILSSYPAVERIVLFGSRARGDHRPTSDIDLALFGPALTAADLTTLRARIDETTIPQWVDLVWADGVAESALLQAIEADGVQWWRRPEGDGRKSSEKQDLR